MNPRIAAALMLAAVLSPSAASAAPGEQTSSSNMPLALYCNTVPHLAVQRSDSVDNWIRICTVWLTATCGKLDAKQVETFEVERTAPGAGQQ